ncbi:phosphatidate cytidylyltransferase [Anaerobacillus sp. MEB173]|uniref:phosphatidate cytidylyltransferase n=1 Tax=Anaerobacillus sp. MEB173 TaxID=3383345 RepID=UPI003F90F698
MKERMITGVIAGIAFIALVVIGGHLFTIGIAILASIALAELLKMKKIPLVSFTGLISLLLMWTILLPNSYYSNNVFADISKNDMFLAFVLLLLIVTVTSKNSVHFGDIGFILAASSYVGFGFHYFIVSRVELMNGMLIVFLILFLIWATDSGAYFIGRKFGKRKLWPEISPKKTIEGSLGGVACAFIVGIVFYSFVPVLDSMSTLVAVILLTSIFGQIGDLVESALKRHYGVKDSGHILPGHGGILDRFDSLIFVMPILHLFQVI